MLKRYGGKKTQLLPCKLDLLHICAEPIFWSYSIRISHWITSPAAFAQARCWIRRAQSDLWPSCEEGKIKIDAASHHLVILFKGIPSSEACFQLNSCVSQSINAQGSHSSLLTHTHHSLCVCVSGDTQYLTFSDGRALKAIIGNVLRDRGE